MILDDGFLIIDPVSPSQPETAKNIKGIAQDGLRYTKIAGYGFKLNEIKTGRICLKLV